MYTLCVCVCVFIPSKTVSTAVRQRHELRTCTVLVKESSQLFRVRNLQIHWVPLGRTTVQTSEWGTSHNLIKPKLKRHSSW